MEKQMERKMKKDEAVFCIAQMRHTTYVPWRKPDGTIEKAHLIKFGIVDGHPDHPRGELMINKAEQPEAYEELRKRAEDKNSEIMTLDAWEAKFFPETKKHTDKIRKLEGTIENQNAELEQLRARLKDATRKG